MSMSEQEALAVLEAFSEDYRTHIPQGTARTRQRMTHTLAEFDQARAVLAVAVRASGEPLQALEETWRQVAFNLVDTVNANVEAWRGDNVDQEVRHAIFTDLIRAAKQAWWAGARLGVGLPVGTPLLLIAARLDAKQQYESSPRYCHTRPLPAAVLTYQNQPDNLGAWKLGRAARSTEPGGDPIDCGLSLLQKLQAEGYGVVKL